MDIYDAHLVFQIIKISICLLAVGSFLYFYREWKKVYHATSLFSFYTTTKIVKKSSVVCLGVLLLLGSFVVEMLPQDTVTSSIVDILQAVAIMTMGYMFYVLFRNEVPKPIVTSSIEQAAEFAKEKQSKKRTTKHSSKRRGKKRKKKK